MSGNRFENLTSIQLTIELKKAPVAYLSIGSLEHHGLHLPVVFYAMWIHQARLAAAEITGGVVCYRLPSGEPGHSCLDSPCRVFN